MSDITQETHDLLEEIGLGRMSITAYDTAWSARMGELESDISNQALEWVRENQLSDGSWGVKDIVYYHDRVICTLAAMIALTYQGRRVQDKVQIQRGVAALEKITNGTKKASATDPNAITVGFELIVPTLVTEAEKLGIIKQQGDRILGQVEKLRNIKMSKLAGLKISRHISSAFSSEMAGTDHIELFDIDNLQESNGSVGNSPAATAYFASYVRKQDDQAISYLKSVIRPNGGVPFAAPFDIFERSWVLWNLALSGKLDDETRELCKPHIAHLMGEWDKQNGLSFSETYSPKDADNTSFAFSALHQIGISLDIQAVLSYEDKDHFRCYPLEAHSSVSVNIHVLGALKQAGFEKDHPSVKKIIKYLEINQIENTHWLDKWHVSPYYPTAHAIIAAQDYDLGLCEKAIQWILRTQKADGSWGRMPNTSTAEETAYCIQALKTWEKHGAMIPAEQLNRALSWLEDNYASPYPPLWIGKVLYCPEHVVKSTVLSAMTLAR